MNWHDHAACKDKPTEWWFSERPKWIDVAKAICAVCPVRIDCQAHAMHVGERHGIWGGLSAEERLRVQRKDRRKRRVDAGGRP